jgi:hypothetical protein
VFLQSLGGIRAGVEKIGSQHANVGGAHAHAELELKIVKRGAKISRALVAVVKVLGQGLANDCV